VFAFACITFRIHEKYSNADAPEYEYCQALLKCEKLWLPTN